MSTSTKSEHVTPAGDNLFADLGFNTEEAADLQARSQRIISGKLAIKHALMTELAIWIDENKLKHADAADILGVTRPRVSDAVNKKVVKFTVDALVDMLARAGKRVDVAVH